MNNFLMFIAALLVLAISALFAAPLFVNWNDYRDVFEQQVSRLVGRQVNVGGDVSLTFLPKPVLRFENINVADAQGGFDAPFMSARSLTVWLSVPPLLRGVVEARDVALDQPILNLQLGPDGQGSWRDIGRPDVALPFMPREVALDSLRIMDATVMVARGTEPPYLTLDHLDGELSARSLQGPYKFAGTFEVVGETQQLKFSTGRQDANGGTRLKALLVNDGGLASYLLDGDLTGFSAAPGFTGAFEAQFVDPDAEQVTQPQQQQPGALGPEIVQPPLQVKAQLVAGPQQAKFTEIEVAIRRSNKPQTITGEMDVSYAGDVTMSGALASRWLDVDSLTTGTSQEARSAGPMPMVNRVAARLLGTAAQVRRLSLDVSVEQAVLAGDLLHDVRAGIVASDGSVVLDSFSARLPGEAELSLKGDLTPHDGASVFKGMAEIKGEKLNRLLGWAGLDTGSTVAQEGEFSLRGAVSAAPGSFSLEEATGQLFRSRFSGALRYSAGERRRFDLTLRSDRLDIGRLGSGLADKLTIPALLRSGEAGDAGKKEGDSTPGWLEGAQAQLDVDIGAVTLPGVGETALTAGVDIDGDNVSIRKLRLVSNEGLRIQASGSLTGLDATPSGSIDLTANADSTQGVQALARLLELEGLAEAEVWRLRAMTPAALTGSIRSAGGGKRGLSAEAKGRLGNNDLNFTASLDGKLATWRDGTVALDARLKSASARALLTQLSSGVREKDLALFENNAGILAFKASGVPAKGMTSALDFSGGGIAFAASGTLTAGAEKTRFDGDATLGAQNGAALLTLAGAHVSPGHSGARLDLKVNVKSAGKLYEIAKLSGAAGDVKISGSGKFDMGGERPRVELDLVTSTASLPFLFEPLIGWNETGPGTTGAVRGVTRSDGFWPDESFDGELLESFDGALKLKSKSIRVMGPLTLADGSLEARLESGTLEIKRIEGAMLGGTVAGQAKFISQAGGLTFNAGAGARGLKLDKIIGGDGLAKGNMDVELEVQAQGLSPRGIASGLAGKGRLTFSEGRIARLEPGTPKKAAAGLTGDNASDEDKLVASIRRELVKGSFAFRPFEAEVRVRNGVARIEKVELRDRQGSAVVTTFLEFTSLNLDSEWLLVSGKADDEDAPRITLAFAGPLAELGEMKPDIDTGALQRHATIRRMEKDVETLEKLEVPGAPKRREPEKKKKEDEKPSAAATPAPQQPRPAAPPARKAPAPVRKPEPPAEVRQQQAPAAPSPSGDSVVSRPLPPASATPQPTTPAQPAPQPFQEQRQPQYQQPQPQPQPGTALPWLGQQQPSPYYDPRQAYDPRQQYQQQPAQPMAPPAAIPQPEPEPQPRQRERDWNPFRQEY